MAARTTPRYVPQVPAAALPAEADVFEGDDEELIPTPAATRGHAARAAGHSNPGARRGPAAAAGRVPGTAGASRAPTAASSRYTSQASAAEMPAANDFAEGEDDGSVPPPAPVRVARATLRAVGNANAAGRRPAVSAAAGRVRAGAPAPAFLNDEGEEAYDEAADGAGANPDPNAKKQQFAKVQTPQTALKASKTLQKWSKLDVNEEYKAATEAPLLRDVKVENFILCPSAFYPDKNTYQMGYISLAYYTGAMPEMPPTPPVPNLKPGTSKLERVNWRPPMVDGYKKEIAFEVVGFLRGKPGDDQFQRTMVTVCLEDPRDVQRAMALDNELKGQFEDQKLYFDGLREAAVKVAVPRLRASASRGGGRGGGVGRGAASAVSEAPSAAALDDGPRCLALANFSGLVKLGGPKDAGMFNKQLQTMEDFVDANPGVDRWPDTMELKVLEDNGELAVDCRDEKNNTIDLFKDFDDGYRVAVLGKITRVYFSRTQLRYGWTKVVTQIRRMDTVHRPSGGGGGSKPKVTDYVLSGVRQKIDSSSAAAAAPGRATLPPMRSVPQVPSSSGPASTASSAHNKTGVPSTAALAAAPAASGAAAHPHGTKRKAAAVPEPQPAPAEPVLTTETGEAAASDGTETSGNAGASGVEDDAGVTSVDGPAAPAADEPMPGDAAADDTRLPAEQHEESAAAGEAGAELAESSGLPEETESTAAAAAAPGADDGARAAEANEPGAGDLVEPAATEATPDVDEPIVAPPAKRPRLAAAPAVTAPPSRARVQEVKGQAARATAVVARAAAATKPSVPTNVVLSAGKPAAGQPSAAAKPLAATTKPSLATSTPAAMTKQAVVARQPAVPAVASKPVAAPRAAAPTPLNPKPTVATLKPSGAAAPKTTVAAAAGRGGQAPGPRGPQAATASKPKPK